MEVEQSNPRAGREEVYTSSRTYAPAGRLTAATSDHSTHTKAGNWANTRDTARLLSHAGRAMLSSQPCPARPRLPVTAERLIFDCLLPSHSNFSAALRIAFSHFTTPVHSSPMRALPLGIFSSLSKAALRHTPYDSPANYDPIPLDMTGSDWLWTGISLPHAASRV